MLININCYKDLKHCVDKDNSAIYNTDTKELMCYHKCDLGIHQCCFLCKKQDDWLCVHIQKPEVTLKFICSLIKHVNSLIK